MKKLSIIDMKHELKELIDIGDMANEFTGIMNDAVMSLDDDYFHEMCLDFSNLINSSPYITKYLKDSCRDVLMNDVKTGGALIQQGEEFKKFVNFVRASARHVRKCINNETKAKEA